MAQYQKTTDSPVTIPSSIAPLVEIFSVESETAAKELIAQVVTAIYHQGEYDYSCRSRPVLKTEVDEVYGLMKAIKPLDILETICAAQIITGHMLGMKKLAQCCNDDQRLALKLLRLSNDAMERLERKRKGNHQNINVTYNNHAPSKQALIASSNIQE